MWMGEQAIGEAIGAPSPPGNGPGGAARVLHTWIHIWIKWTAAYLVPRECATSPTWRPRQAGRAARGCCDGGTAAGVRRGVLQGVVSVRGGLCGSGERASVQGQNGGNGR